VVSLGIFSGGLPTEPCALGSTQPLNMSTRNSPGGEGGRCFELTTNHPSSAERQEIRGLNLPGPPRAPGGLLREYLYLYLYNCSVALCGDLLNRVLPKSVQKYGQYIYFLN
jgi:hypothetical protein